MKNINSVIAIGASILSLAFAAISGAKPAQAASFETQVHQNVTTAVRGYEDYGRADNRDGYREWRPGSERIIERPAALPRPVYPITYRPILRPRPVYPIVYRPILRPRPVYPIIYRPIVRPRPIVIVRPILRPRPIVIVRPVRVYRPVYRDVVYRPVPQPWGLRWYHRHYRAYDRCR